MRYERPESAVLRRPGHHERQRQRAFRIFRRRGDRADGHGPDVGDLRAVGRASGGSSTTATTSSGGAIVYNPPSTTTERADTFETRIVGRIDGTVVFDQTVDAAFGDAAAQAAVADAEATIAAAGGPGTTISDPARTAGDTTPAGTTSASVFTLAATTTGDLIDPHLRARQYPDRPEPGLRRSGGGPAERDPAGMRRRPPDLLLRGRAGHGQCQHARAEHLCRRRGGDADRHVPHVGDVRDRRHPGSTFTTTTSCAGAITYNEPTTTTQRADTFATRIVGKFGDTVVFDQTVAAPFDDPAVQAAVAQAEAAVAAAGGPGTDIADPAQTANDTTLAGTTSASLFSLDHTDTTLSTTTTFGPTTILIGDDTTCAAAIATLPGTTRPECVTDGQSQPFFVVAGTTNVNTNTHRRILLPRR